MLSCYSNISLISPRVLLNYSYISHHSFELQEQEVSFSFIFCFSTIQSGGASQVLLVVKTCQQMQETEMQFHHKGSHLGVATTVLLEFHGQRGLGLPVPDLKEVMQQDLAHASRPDHEFQDVNWHLPFLFLEMAPNSLDEWRKFFLYFWFHFCVLTQGIIMRFH